MDFEKCWLPVTLTTVGILTILLAFSAPFIPKGDGASMFAVAESIVNNGSISVPPTLGTEGRDGRYFSVWYPLLSVILVPFVEVGEELGRKFDLPQHYAASACALVLPVLLISANALLTIVLALRLGASLEGALWAGLAFVFGTIALPNARELLADPLLALLTTGAIYCALGVSNTLNISASTAICALAVLAKPTGIVVGPALAVLAIVKRRGFSVCALPFAGTLLGLTLYLFYNEYRFGNPLKFGQPYNFSMRYVPLGLLGQLFSPAHGLPWYCPAVVALVWLPKSIFRRPDVLLIIGVELTFLLFYSLWGTWDAGWCWGPRFLIAGLPGVMALTGLLDVHVRPRLIGLMILGTLTAVPTLVSYYQRTYVESAAIGITDSNRDWSPSQAPLLTSWSATYRSVNAALQPENNINLLLRRVGAYHGKTDEMPSLQVIALWWWMLPAAGIPAWIGALAAVSMIATGIVLLRCGLREARIQDSRATEATQSIRMHALGSIG